MTFFGDKEYMKEEKALSDEALGYKVSAENWRESYFKLMDKYAKAVRVSLMTFQEIECIL